MFGFDPLIIGSLAVLAGGAPSCEMPKGTEINVTPKTLKVKYDYTQSLENIQKVKSDTIDPHGFGGYSITQGYMRGGIKLAPQVKLKYITYERQGLACIWYDSIDVTLEIDPTIVIAREVHQDRCMHGAVLEHEMKHVKVDRKIVNKYASLMGKKLYEGLSERGFKSGLIRASGTQEVMKRMQETVYEIVKHEYRKLELERIDLQRAIDSKGEYDRVSAICPGFKKKQKIFSNRTRDLNR